MTLKNSALFLLPTTDFDPTETAIPWQFLREAGFSVTFATPEAEVGTADPRVVTGKGFGPWQFLRADKRARRAYEALCGDDAYRSPRRYADVDAADYSVLHIPGGHAPGMKELLESERVRELIAAFFAANKLIGAICHGVLAVARTKGSDGKSVLYGRKTTALPERMELIAWRLTRLWLGDYYRTYPVTVQDEVTAALAAPGDFLPGPNSVRKDSPQNLERGFVVEDGSYISARWPGDAHAYGTALVAAAKRRA